MSTEENKSVVQRSYDEFFNTGNLALVDQFHTIDFVGHVLGLPPVQSLEALKYLASGYLSAFPDLHITVEDMIAEGDKVMTRVSWRGTHK
jgi:predicted ester cyclase